MSCYYCGGPLECPRCKEKKMEICSKCGWRYSQGESHSCDECHPKAMTTLRERAVEIYNLLKVASGDFKLGISCGDCELDRIERHLREACEEAVREHRLANKEFYELKQKPTAEDALKAVMEVCKIEMGPSLSDWANEYPKLLRACADLLAGRRDTEAARSITGGGK